MATYRSYDRPVTPDHGDEKTLAEQPDCGKQVCHTLRAEGGSLKNWQPFFEAGLEYGDFLRNHGLAAHRQRWKAAFDQVTLTTDQTALLIGFARQTSLPSLAGARCGDWANQYPIRHGLTEALFRRFGVLTFRRFLTSAPTSIA